MKAAITGVPGVGKTTACLKIYSALKDRMSVKGFITSEIRERGFRAGFVIKELHTDFSEILAKKGDGFPRVGKYAVFLDSLEKISRRIEGYADADLIVMDEIGPMELKSRSFVNAVGKILDTHENIILTVHYRSKHPLAERVRREFELFELTRENRNRVVEKLVMRIDR